MTSVIKYLFVLTLMFSFIGCQNDAPQKETPQDPQQSLQGQMQQQQPAPDVNLSEGELESFTDAIVSAQKVQMESQQSMMDMIKDEGLDVDTYNKIAQANQRGQSPEQAGVSSEDVKKYKSVNEDIRQAQAEADKKMSSAIEDAGMDMERFQEINRAVQQDPKLQKKVMQKMQESQMGQ